MQSQALGVRAFLATDDPMPVIVRTGGLTKGLLLRGLTMHAWNRIRFFESDDYYCAGLHVSLAQGNSAQAFAFWPLRSLRRTAKPWNFRAWQRADKELALVAARQFMDYFGASAEVDLAEAWRRIKANLAA